MTGEISISQKIVFDEIRSDLNKTAVSTLMCLEQKVSTLTLMTLSTQTLQKLQKKTDSKSFKFLIN